MSKNDIPQKQFDIHDNFLYHCCGAKLVKIQKNSVLVNFAVYCDKCKKEFIVNIINGKLI